jgi:FtsP/CotA-like multicopper oxidase with cupredoxin domain
MNKNNKILSVSIALMCALLVTVAPASAAVEEVHLRALPFDKTVRDGSGDGSGTTTVPMWGYASCTGASGTDFSAATCGAPTSPGPVIELMEGDDLTIYVDNQLPAGLVNVTNETSVLIPALPKHLTPVRFPVTGDPSRDNRIYSFDSVTANNSVGTYTWIAPTPGTYLYHSGTHLQVQVQMGLYGSLVVEASTSPDCLVAPCAYSDVSYGQDAVVVLSEIDPSIHTAVATDVYGTPAGPTSTESYHPRFFLINGESFPSPSLDPLFTAARNGDLLLRVLNAGIETNVLQLLGVHFEVIAEDGNRTPASRSQITLQMPAAKTKDILLHPSALGTLTLFERRLRTVNDIGANGGMFARINVENFAPVADAGPTQAVITGDPAQLDGSGSSDANGDMLTYAWTFTSVPPGSAILDTDLSDATAVNPEFTPDVDGDYVVQLTVDDGTVGSAPDSVTISAAPPIVNTPPVAVAGPAQAVPAGTEATLDGSGSNDAETDPLTYAWTITSVPAGSAITTSDLSDPTDPNATFTPDAEGAYVVQLIVNDGMDDSTADSVTVTAENVAPLANAGPNQSVDVIATVMLDGSASSDTIGDTLSFSWSITSVPIGSAVMTGTASLSDATIVNPEFVPDVEGIYLVQLIVNDGTVDSLPDEVAITASVPVVNTPPVADAGPAQSEFINNTVQLDGSGSSDAEMDPLTYAWSIFSTPVGSTTAALSDAGIINPTFVPDVPGAYVVNLMVNDSLDDSLVDSVTITANPLPPNTTPVANAGLDQTINLGETAQLSAAASSDGDGDPLTNSWSIISVPVGSAITTGSLSDFTIFNPTFVPDVTGDYVAQLFVNDGTENSPTDTVTITVIISTGGTGLFEQTGGILSMEAEHFATNNAASGVAVWTLLDPSANAANAMAIKSAGGAQTYSAGTGPFVTYEAQMDAGTQSVWVRFRSFSGTTDSFFFQLDGGPIQTRQLNPDDGAWHWIEVVPPVTVGTAGVHTVTIYRREMETELDKLVLTTDPAFDPALVGSGLGPDESPRVGGGGNTPPMASAGPDQIVTVADTVQLDGSGSSDVDGDTPTYSWLLTTVPVGSTTAMLSDTTIVDPTFVPDVVGDYIAHLIVNDGLANSIADSVTITAGLPVPNTPPVANAGPDAAVPVAVAAQLDGSGSSDADSDPLTAYTWTITSVPVGSAVNTASLSDASIVNPTFVPDVVGDYIAELIVNDGTDPSIADAVTITAQNTVPVADAGPDQIATITNTVQLDGIGSSDANGDTLTYTWLLTTVPPGSTTAALSDPAIVDPTFVPDVAGDYIAQLIVNDGTVDSIADSATITANVAGGTGPFDQTGGVASLEAEHFTTNVAAGGVAEWLLLDPSAGASATMAIKSAGGAQTYSAGTGPSITYETRLDAGTQYVWVRYRSFSGVSDSFFFQFNGEAIQSRGLGPDDGQWRWIELATPITVGTSGVNTLTIYRREMDVEIDKVVLTTNPTFDPAIVNLGLGPDESPRL